MVVVSTLRITTIGIAAGGVATVLLVHFAPLAGGLNGGDPWIIAPASWLGAVVAGIATGLAMKQCPWMSGMVGLFSGVAALMVIAAVGIPLETYQYFGLWGGITSEATEVLFCVSMVSSAAVCNVLGAARVFEEDLAQGCEATA